jgi:hypothetical protein
MGKIVNAVDSVTAQRWELVTGTLCILLAALARTGNSVIRFLRRDNVILR